MGGALEPVARSRRVEANLVAAGGEGQYLGGRPAQIAPGFQQPEGEVAVMADRGAKDRLGNLADAWSAVKATVRAPNSEYIITLDGQELHSHGVICIILNQSAGLMKVKPPVDGSDGLLDVVVFRDESLRTVGKAAGNLMLKNENLVPAEHWQGIEVTVVSQPAQAIQADGEILPPGSVSVRVLPSAVRFVVPGAKAQ